MTKQLSSQYCQFCYQRSAHYAPLEEMESFGVKVFFCHECQAEYLFFSTDGEPITPASSVSLYTEIDGKTYRWTIIDVTGRRRRKLWLVGQPGIPGVKRNSKLDEIMSFDERNGDILPNLTPQNVQEKIRSWLLLL